MKAEALRAEQKQHKLDLVTVCFAPDLNLLKLQARSVAKFVDPQILGKILIIINDRHTGAVRRQIRRRILKEYGPLAPRVQILDRRTVGGFYFGKSGWGTQQALKLLAANHVSAPTLMILDCKTHFIRALDKSCVWAEDGRIKTREHKVITRYAPYFETACDYFEVKDRKDQQPALPTVPPFLVPTLLVQDLVRAMEGRENRSFMRLFMQKKRRFTEFYLVYAYILSVYGGLEELFERSPHQAVNLVASDRENPDQVRRKLAGLEDENCYCFGVHRAVVESANKPIVAAISEAWQRFGLVASVEEAGNFLTPVKQNQISWWPFFVRR